MPINIRQAVAADAMAVAVAHVRSWQVGYRGLLPAAYLDGLRPEDRASRYGFEQMNPDGPFTQVAVDGDTICGHVTTGRCRDDDLQGGGEIWALYVDPSRWGGGIGHRLITAYAADSVVEGFAEAFAHYLRRPWLLRRRDIDSEEFLEEWLDSRKRSTR